MLSFTPYKNKLKVEDVDKASVVKSSRLVTRPYLSLSLLQRPIIVILSLINHRLLKQLFLLILDDETGTDLISNVGLGRRSTISPADGTARSYHHRPGTQSTLCESYMYLCAPLRSALTGRVVVHAMVMVSKK